MPENGDGINLNIFNLFKVEHLPKWCGSFVMLTILIVATIYTWSQYGGDIYNPISKLEAAQFTESQKHFWEQPEDEFPLDEGGVARHYSSDHCAAVQWLMPDGSVRTTFAFHPKRTQEILDGPHPLNSIKVAGMGGCPGPGPGCCWDPHPPPWNEKGQPLDQCVVRVWRMFNDGCIHYQDMNRCGQNGYVVWTRCVH